MNIVNIAKVESMANILPSNAIVFIHQCTGQLDILGHNFWDILVQPYFIVSTVCTHISLIHPIAVTHSKAFKLVILPDSS